MLLPINILNGQKINLSILLPLILYLLLNVLASFFNYFTIKNSAIALRLPIYFFISHFFYGIGLILGFFVQNKNIKSNEIINLINIDDESDLRKRIKKYEQNS
jgi:hypothetical protein